MIGRCCTFLIAEGDALSGFAAAAKALRSVDSEHLLLPLLMQLIVIILAARLFAAFFQRLGQPVVAGEILAGLILGPSVLGRLSPELFAWLFKPTIHGLDPALASALFGKVMTSLAQIGLILLLFLIGLEFDFGHLRMRGPSAIAVSVAGVALPFFLGLGLAPLMIGSLEPHPETGEPVPLLGFSLFLGTALSITAIPILGRIMMELNITRSRMGAITISAAAVDDAIGWTLLASVAALVRGNFSVLSTLAMMGETVLFAGFLIWGARPLLCRWAKVAARRGEGGLAILDMAILIAILFACAVVTNLIGIFAIFGAFLLGAVLSTEEEFRHAVQRSMRDFVTSFFLPIFFTFTGLRTDASALESGTLWLWCGAVLLAALVGKWGGCGIAAYLTGFSLREATCIGVMMNTRALMELIVINVGYDLGVIPRSAFCMLVFMAVITTIMTTPLLLAAMKGTEIEPLIRESEFWRRNSKPAATGSP